MKKVVIVLAIIFLITSIFFFLTPHKNRKKSENELKLSLNQKTQKSKKLKNETFPQKNLTVFEKNCKKKVVMVQW